MRFVDTNVVLYAVSGDPRERDKAAKAATLLTSPDLALSVQVLQEFFVQATRPSRAHRLDHADAVAMIETLLRFPVSPVTVPVLRADLDLCGRWSLSFWDAAIIEAARSLGCDVVLSEDIGDGEDYDGVRVVNPFATDVAS